MSQEAKDFEYDERDVVMVRSAYKDWLHDEKIAFRLGFGSFVVALNYLPYTTKLRSFTLLSSLAIGTFVYNSYVD